MPQVEVTFDIDANGIVNVSAKDKATGKEQQIRIQASGGLSDKDIEQMVRDAESHAAEDKKRREAIEAKNRAESMIHEAEKNLSEHGAIIKPQDKSAIEDAISGLKSVIDSGDKARIEEKTQTLTQAMMKIGEDIYRAQQEQAAGGNASNATPEPSGSDAATEGEVLDADFEELGGDAKKD
jgi:molecular chaperone DnaK